jgi:hypothetical protein
LLWKTLDLDDLSFAFALDAYEVITARIQRPPFEVQLNSELVVSFMQLDM